MKNTLVTVLFSLISWVGMAQTQPNPDLPQEGPIKVTTERPVTRENQAREASQNPLLDKLRLGGSFGLSLGTITNIDVSPMAAIQVNERLAVGGGITFQVIKSRLFNVNQNIFGGRTFAFYHLFQGINLNTEFESLNRQYTDITTNTNKRTWLNSFMVGGSYSQPIGGRFTRAINMTVLYNLSYNGLVNPTDPFQNIYPTSSPLIFRVSFL